MITSFYVTTAIITLATMSSISTNPVKVSMILTVLSSTIFLKMKMNGNSWFPILFFLIFMGGILMMFMILSSVLPNEKSSISKKMLEAVVLISLTGNLWVNWELTSQASSVKAFVQSSDSFFFLTIMMVLYFFLSIKMVSEEEMALRSVFCYKNGNLVNC